MEIPVEVDSTETEKPLITFAVAGHIYGNSDHYTHSVYPPFLKKFKEDQKQHDFAFLFLTGDVLYDSNQVTWHYVKAQLDSLEIHWWIAPGNHDEVAGSMPQSLHSTDSTDRASGISVLSDKSNLYFILNTSNPGWTIGSEAALRVFDMLYQTDSVKNIFVFTHQLWWERNAPKEFQLDSLRPNSFALYDGPSDFWSDAFPNFESTGIETWFFAGDLGADEKLDAYYEDHFEQFHFYGSGMGGGNADNYLIVEVYQNGRVDIEKVNF